MRSDSATGGGGLGQGVTGGEWETGGGSRYRPFVAVVPWISERQSRIEDASWSWQTRPLKLPRVGHRAQRPLMNATKTGQEQVKVPSIAGLPSNKERVVEKKRPASRAGTAGWSLRWIAGIRNVKSSPAHPRVPSVDGFDLCCVVEAQGLQPIRAKCVRAPCVNTGSRRRDMLPSRFSLPFMACG
jgi:hypothetical protein